MENRNSSLLIGLGVGSVIGALAYRFSRTSKAKKLKEKVADAGKTVADKAADKASEFAGKADDFKNKVHTMASEVKR